MLTCVDLCSSVQDEAERYRCIERCVSIAKGGPAPPPPPSCMPADAVYELNDFIAAYRRAPKGFEDWQIASRIASVIASAIKKCEMDKVVEYISAALDASGIDRYAVYSTYIHSLSSKVVEALYHIFPNIAPRIGVNAPIIIPTTEPPPATTEITPPPAVTAEAKDAPRGGLKEPPVAGPGEAVLRVGGLARHEAQVGTVRLPLSAMERLGLKPGDFVEIIGTTSTYAVVQPTEEEDVVKMDEVTRSNAGAELGDYVRIKKTVLPPAEKIVLKTNQPVDAEYVKRYLLFKPLARGNITAVPQQDKTATLRVEDVVPAPAAYVQLSTKIEIQHDNTAHSKRQQPMYKSSTPEVSLKVFDVNKQDYGRSIVRIPARIMKRLGIYPGDYVEIVGRKTAYAQAWLVNPEDEDKDIVQMDCIIRQTVGVGIDDAVKIKKATLKPAQKVVLAPTEPARVDPEYLKEQILDKPVARGQTIIVSFYGSVIRFVVVEVQPEPAAYVSIDTVIEETTRIEIQHDNTVCSEHRRSEVGSLSTPETLLQVAETNLRDIGRSIVRIPVRIMKKLGIGPGDYVEIVVKKIVRKKSAYVQVWPAYPEDEDKDIVRMDSIIRQNAGVGIGDTVKVRPLKPAQRVVLAPTEPVRVDPEYLKKQILLGKPVARGQAIDVPFYGGAIRFVVVQVQPGPAAYVSIDTNVIIKGVERTSSEGYSKPSTISMPSRELSAVKELLLGTADLFRAFGFFLLFAAFIYVTTNYDAVGFNMPIFISSVGYFASALISPIVSTFADRRAWASALIGALGTIPHLAYMSKASEGAPADLFIFAVLWLGITVAITIQTRLEEWGSRQFYAALAGVIGVGYMVLAIAKTIDAIRRYARAV